MGWVARNECPCLYSCLTEQAGSWSAVWKPVRGSGSASIKSIEVASFLAFGLPFFDLSYDLGRRAGEQGSIRK